MSAAIDPQTQTMIDNMPDKTGKIFGGMCTHRVRLTSPADLDEAVTNWLKQAYDVA